MIISQPVFHQTLAITPVLLSSFMTGINFGWLPAILQLHTNSDDDFSLTETSCSWMVSLQYIGYLIGCVLLLCIVDRFGRNAVIILSAVAVMLSWIGVTLTRSVVLHLLIRSVSGVSVGLNIPILPIYIGENSSPLIRGVFSSTVSFFLYAGMLIGCTIPTYCSFQTTGYIMMAMSLVNLASTILLREPAQYLLAKGHTAQAEKQFFWLRGNNESTQKEFNEMKLNLSFEKAKLSLAVVSNRYFLFICIISVLVYFTGYAALCALVSVILVPTKQFSTNELTILYELFQLFGGFISPFIIDTFGRRTLWIVSAALIAMLHFCTAAVFFAREKGLQIPQDAWLLCASITAYAAIFSCTMFPLNIIAKTELLTHKLRSIGSSTSSILTGLAAIISGPSYFWIALNFGVQTNFICYGFFSLMVLVFCYFYLPETKGKSLIEIEKILENSQKKMPIS